MNNRFLTALTLIFIAIPGITQTQAEGNGVELNSLIAEALQNNPGLQASYKKMRSDSASISVSGALPDPVISLNLLNLPVNSFRFDQEPMTGKQITLRQSFPFFGTLGLKKSISSRHTQISLQNFLEYENKLIKEVKALYYEINYIQSGIRITSEKETLMKSLVEVIATKYSVGQGLQQDILKAQVELAKIIGERIYFKRKREELIPQLNALLNRDANTSISKTDSLSYTPQVINRDKLYNSALTDRPLLRKLKITVDSKEEEISLAQKKYYPDMAAFAAYTQRNELANGGSGVDFLSAGLSFSVPLYAGSKQSSDVVSKEMAKEEAELNFENTKKQVLADIDETIASLNRNSELVNLYRDGIIPQARQSLKSAITGYQTNKVDFITLLDNYMTLFKFELSEQRIISDYYKELTKLDFITGKNEKQRQTLRNNDRM